MLSPGTCLQPGEPVRLLTKLSSLDRWWARLRISLPLNHLQRPCSNSTLIRSAARTNNLPNRVLDSTQALLTTSAPDCQTLNLYAESELCCFEYIILRSRPRKFPTARGIIWSYMNTYIGGSVQTRGGRGYSQRIWVRQDWIKDIIEDCFKHYLYVTFTF